MRGGTDMKKNSTVRNAGKAIASLPLYIYCLVSLGFLFYAFINPFKTTKEFFKNILGLPQTWSFDNIVKVWKDANFGQFYLNSIFTTVVATVLILVVASLGAYGLSRYRFRGNKALNTFFLMGMMVPINVMIIPLFLVARNIGLVDRLFGLAVIFTATTYSFSVFVLSGSFKTLPFEIYEAAKIDGASELRIFATIMIPMARPVLGTLATITAINVWNDYFVSMIMIYENNKRTLPIALANFCDANSANWPLVFAAVFIATVPIIVVYFFGSKQIVRGLTQGAIK